jgi:hypothetical protein
MKFLNRILGFILLIIATIVTAKLFYLIQVYETLNSCTTQCDLVGRELSLKSVLISIFIFIIPSLFGFFLSLKFPERIWSFIINVVIFISLLFLYFQQSNTPSTVPVIKPNTSFEVNDNIYPYKSK